MRGRQQVSRSPSHGTPSPSAGGYWATQVRAGRRERLDERRRLQWAALGTLLLHGAVFSLRLPEGGPSLPEPPERPVFAMTEVRFQPREPEPPRAPEPLRPRERQPTIIVPGPPEFDPEPVEFEPAALPIDVAPLEPIDFLPAAPPPPPAETGPVRYDASITRPERLHAPLPPYTEPARRVRRQGRMILEAVIDVSGAVTDVRVVKGLGMGLDRSAVETVSAWRFKPAQRGGQPVAVIYTLVIDFRLQ